MTGYQRLAVRSVNRFLDRLSVNAQIIHNMYLVYPIPKGDHEEWLQVGRGQITNVEWCGRHTSFFVCFEKHDGVVYHGEDYSGKDAVSHGHRWCKDPSCPKCFLDGWAVGNARAIWGKMSAAIAKGYVRVEHYAISFPAKDYDLPESVLRKRAEDGCVRRGIMGGVLVVHARRIDRKHRALRFSIHYHGLGFVSGGYDVCRDCPYLAVSKTRSWCSNESECEGFEQRTRREYERDGLVVKVLGRRSSGLTEEESVIRTAKYVLSHASYKKSFLRRFYVVSFFGVCANKKLRSLKVPRVHECPACLSVGVKNEMKRCHNWTREFIAKDIGDLRYRKVFPSEKFDESGLPKFVECSGGGLDG